LTVATWANMLRNNIFLQVQSCTSFSHSKWKVNLKHEICIPSSGSEHKNEIIIIISKLSLEAFRAKNVGLAFDVITSLQEILSEWGLGMFGQRWNFIFVDIFQDSLICTHHLELTTVNYQVGA
jgi:hypothetical protein